MSAEVNNKAADNAFNMLDIKAMVKGGDVEQAKGKLIALLETKFPFKVVEDSFEFDADNALALNSLRARFQTDDGQDLFLKSHQEEKEADRLKGSEYYKSGVLEQAGFPIDSARYHSSEVGEQLVVYDYVSRDKVPELHGVARDIDAGAAGAIDVDKVLAAYDAFQRKVGKIYCDTLHVASDEVRAGESVHALFYRRLVDNDGDDTLGGRVEKFYLGQTVRLPNDTELSFEEFAKLKWNINGRSYDITLEDAFNTARDTVYPSKTGVGAVTAHGDDHTGNLLFDPNAAPEDAIKYFDPAFAGENIPALQAACKALYHCIFAHPNMLYNPEEYDGSVDVSVDGDVINVNHSWELPALRKEFLASQLQHVWKPLISELDNKGFLPENWEQIVRSTLFCCPTLCKNLLAGLGDPNPLTPETSALTFAIAVSLHAAPKNGSDYVSEFFEEIKKPLNKLEM